MVVSGQVCGTYYSFMSHVQCGAKQSTRKLAACSTVRHRSSTNRVDVSVIVITFTCPTRTRTRTHACTVSSRDVNLRNFNLRVSHPISKYRSMCQTRVNPVFLQGNVRMHELKAPGSGTTSRAFEHRPYTGIASRPPPRRPQFW